ncbi:MAG: patatin-like phospholipase family protein [Bacteroidetes bacterium]|nr:patatin-like phospholipase family protein [Bacteroidota bacterium]
MQPIFAQKVGVVLSGGGASGLAHIGVLKALEENDIPIDYITGTSMGALVGALYASGMSPIEIEVLVKSTLFQQIAYGIIDEKYVYYFKQKEPNSSWITIRFTPNSFIESTLPTNLISPIPADLTLLEQFSGPAAVANYNFDSLFVPFRCVAADIVAKKQVIFKKGNLNEAVRASISYPFYLKPMKIDGKLLFDGGLYNNFPSDIMLADFFPDIIIGSSVTGNAPPPEEDNLISQIKSILVTNSNFSTLCENGIMIEPKTDVSLFDFDDPATIIKQGYDEALLHIIEIKSSISRRVDQDSLSMRRVEFRQKIPALTFNNVHINGLNKKQSNYVRKILLQKDRKINFSSLKKNYYRLISDDKINYIYPVAIYNPNSSNYDLFLSVKKERELIAHFGGNISNKPINQGFVGLQYNYLGAQALSISANTYFGKLYGSGQMKARIDFSTRLPFYIEGGHTLNRWDFFRSSNAFFEDVRPSYLIQNESYSDIIAGIPVFNKGKLKGGASYAHLRNDYYQTKTFTLADTADKTLFRLASYFLSFERNSLNRKQYASEGFYFNVASRFIHGEEFTRPGSSALPEKPFRGIHDWVQVKATLDSYLNKKGRFKFGLYLEGNYSNQPFFHNYTSTILAAPAFTPTPETRTVFLEKFRAHNYGALGLKHIFSIRKNLDLRIEGYVFQPINEIVRNPDQTAGYGNFLESRSFIGTTNLVFHTPLGPLSVSMNYYEKEEIPWSFLFHFGYILFNKRALD